MNYKELKVWQISHELCLNIYKITNRFEASEKYALISQMRRASYSIPMNIAEGKAYTSRKKFAYFLEIARGSSSELEYQLLLSKDLGYICINEYNECIEKIVYIQKVLTNLIKSLRD